MAQLNLRDRVIETTIAYVGNAASNFAHVQSSPHLGRAGALQETVSGGGRVVSLDWRPRATVADCDLRVTLVSAPEPAEADTVRQMLVDADGLVLVLEADPAAAERNSRAVDTVREALERAAKKVPVVVQIGQGEGADASGEALAALGTEEWPRVPARADKGEGVMETLQRAVDGVVDAMQKRPDGGDPVPRATLKAEGNPLLGALRHLLQATVTEQIAALEGRLIAHLELGTRAPSGGNDELGEQMVALSARMDQLEVTLGASLAELSARERAATPADLERAQTRILSEQARIVAEVKGQRDVMLAQVKDHRDVILAGVKEQREGVRAEMKEHREAIVSETKEHRDTVLGEVKEHRKMLGAELSRALGGALAPLQKAIDALSVELKKVTAHDQTSNVAAAVHRFETVSEGMKKQVESLFAASRTVASRLDELGSSLQEIDAHAGSRAREVSDWLREFGENASGRAEATHAELAELVEEIRKKKKSWFS